MAYEPGRPTYFARPDTGAFMDLNTVPESVIDELMGLFGGQAPILERKGYLQGERQKVEEQQKAEQMKKDLLQEEVAKRTNANLRGELENIFGGVQQSGIDAIKRNAATDRSKLLQEEAAMGRLRSPAAIGTVSKFDEGTGNQISDLVGRVAAQKGAGMLDVSKAIEAMLQNERQGVRSERMFGQELGLKRDSLLNSISQAGEDRAFDRYKFDRGAAIRRDELEPEEWEKQLGRINNTIDTSFKYPQKNLETFKMAGDSAKSLKDIFA